MKKSVLSSPWRNNCGTNYGAYECSLCVTGDQCKCVFLSPLADIREYGEVWKAMVTEEGLWGEYFCVLTKNVQSPTSFPSQWLSSVLLSDVIYGTASISRCVYEVALFDPCYLVWFVLLLHVWKACSATTKAQHENKCQPKSKQGRLCVNCRGKSDREEK